MGILLMMRYEIHAMTHDVTVFYSFFFVSINRNHTFQPSPMWPHNPRAAQFFRRSASGRAGVAVPRTRSAHCLPPDWDFSEKTSRSRASIMPSITDDDCGSVRLLEIWFMRLMLTWRGGPVSQFHPSRTAPRVQTWAGKARCMLAIRQRSGDY